MSSCNTHTHTQELAWQAQDNFRDEKPQSYLWAVTMIIVLRNEKLHIERLSIENRPEAKG